MSAQLVHFCTRKCRAEDMRSGDSQHFLDCTVWPWNGPVPTRYVPHDTPTVLTLPHSATPLLESIRAIGTFACYSSIIIGLIVLLTLYFKVF